MRHPIDQSDRPLTSQLCLPQDNQQLSSAMLRAYPWPRMLDYGMSIDDTWAVSAQASAVGWLSTTFQRARNNYERALQYQLEQLDNAASQSFLRAAACLRLCQSALDQEPALRAQVYAMQSNSFRRAMDVKSRNATELPVFMHDCRHQGWLYLADQKERHSTHKCVIVIGGADGWCEAFYPSVARLNEYGISVYLLELPGQGLAYLRHGSYLSADFAATVSKALDVLSRQDTWAFNAFGIIGHSLGGTLAMAVAAEESRISACVSNGGSIHMERGLLKFPRILSKVDAMAGGGTNAGLDLLHQLNVAKSIPHIAGSLLVLHGDQDRLIEVDEVEALPEATKRGNITIRRWENGEHCLYSIAEERDTLVAAWFAKELARP